MTSAPELVPPERLFRRRSITESSERFPKRELRAGAAELPESINAEDPRPRTWGECQAYGLGTPDLPCPYVSCRHHLYLDVNSCGSITFNAPGLEPDELVETCVLRVAGRGGMTLEEVGDLLAVTRERIRQIESRAFKRVRGKKTGRDLREGIDDR